MAAFKESLKQVTELLREMGIIDDVSPTILARVPGSTLNRALLVLNMHNTCSRPGVAQVRW